MDARPEEVAESQTRDTTLQEEASRVPTLEQEDTPQVGAHTMNAEGDDSIMASISKQLSVSMAVVGIGILATWWMISSKN